MKLSRRDILFVILLLSVQTAFGEVPGVISDYRRLCDRTLQAVLETSSGTNIVDVFPVYLSGWIQATNAVPVLLDIVDVPRGTNDVGSCGGYYRWGVITTPRPPTPPTPAAGALSIGPVDLATLTNRITQAGAGTRRAELLVWVAEAKFGDRFHSIIDAGVASNDPLWVWVQDCIPRLLPPPRPFLFREFAFRFPKEDMEEYLRIFRFLRSLAESAESAGDPDFFRQAKDALIEIGHPYDEDQSLWPQ